ncbi:MAG: putative acetyltransferase, family [Flavipsychrobacter sp.]|nr:putative acetyltransferase, family [Flavipsychrobacter sp.]
MNTKEQYILENDVVLLRPLEASDYAHLLWFSENEPDLWRFNYVGAAGADNLKTYIDRALTQRERELEYSFIVFDKRTGRYAGTTNFYNIRQDYKTLEIGFTWYGKEFQGTGLNINCKYLLLEFVFELLNWERVGFAANNANERSKHAMKSIGCTQEGVLRNASINAQGERIDIVVLSILKSEWTSHVKENLKNKIAG